MSYYDRHSGKSKFRQNGNYLPKVPNQNSIEWRRRKGFSKDQSKGEAWCKCQRWLKTLGSRNHRRWSKRLIHMEQYDDLYYHQDMFVSSWDAC